MTNLLNKISTALIFAGSLGLLENKSYAQKINELNKGDTATIYSGVEYSCGWYMHLEKANNPSEIKKDSAYIIKTGRTSIYTPGIIKKGAKIKVLEAYKIKAGFYPIKIEVIE